jgi:hypothetical protein
MQRKAFSQSVFIHLHLSIELLVPPDESDETGWLTRSSRKADDDVTVTQGLRLPGKFYPVQFDSVPRASVSLKTLRLHHSSESSMSLSEPLNPFFSNFRCQENISIDTCVLYS